MPTSAGKPGKRASTGKPGSPTCTGNPGTEEGRGRGGGRDKGKETEQEEEEEARLSKILESARQKHRREVGKGRPLLGWDVAAFAGFVFEELAKPPFPSRSKDGGHAKGKGKVQAQEKQVVALSGVGFGLSGGEEQEVDGGEAVAAAVDAVTATAEKAHAGQVRFVRRDKLLGLRTGSYLQ